MSSFIMGNIKELKNFIKMMIIKVINFYFYFFHYLFLNSHHIFNYFNLLIYYHLHNDSA